MNRKIDLPSVGGMCRWGQRRYENIGNRHYGDTEKCVAGDCDATGIGDNLV
jgi:hypothetical protein